MAMLPRPSGALSAVVGGIVGAGAGTWLSYLLYAQVAVGDLSDIGSGLLLLLAGLLLGPGFGTAVGLSLRKHERAVATGLVAGPALAGAVAGGFTILGSLPLPDDAAGFLGLPVIAALGIAALWIARWLTAP